MSGRLEIYKSQRLTARAHTGAATFLSIIPGSASIANQTFTKFLQRVPAVKSEIVAPQMSIPDRMKEALERQSALVGKKDITSLDPLCPLSFSCLTEEAAQKQAELIAEYSKGRFSAFDPLGPDGRPPRKYGIPLVSFTYRFG